MFHPIDLSTEMKKTKKAAYKIVYGKVHTGTHTHAWCTTVYVLRTNGVVARVRRRCHIGYRIIYSFVHSYKLRAREPPEKKRIRIGTESRAAAVQKWSFVLFSMHLVIYPSEKTNRLFASSRGISANGWMVFVQAVCVCAAAVCLEDVFECYIDARRRYVCAEMMIARPLSTNVLVASSTLFRFTSLSLSRSLA